MHASGYQHSPFGISVNVGWVVVVGAAFGGALVPAGDGGLRLTVLALAVGGFAVYAALAVAVCVAVLGFVLMDGFLVNGGGDLSWHGSADLGRLTVLLAAAGIGFGVGAVRRQVVRRRRYAPVRAWLVAGAAGVDGDLTFASQPSTNGFGSRKTPKGRPSTSRPLVDVGADRRAMDERSDLPALDDKE